MATNRMSVAAYALAPCAGFHRLRQIVDNVFEDISSAVIQVGGDVPRWILDSAGRQ